MKVLTIYAHHDPRSFCHGVLERFTDGLREAGHTSEVIDLYAIKSIRCSGSGMLPAMWPVIFLVTSWSSWTCRGG